MDGLGKEWREEFKPLIEKKKLGNWNEARAWGLKNMLRFFEALVAKIPCILLKNEELYGNVLAMKYIAHRSTKDNL